MFRQFHISVILSVLGLTFGACNNQAQASGDPKENAAAVSEASPKDVESYTLEEIRAEQEIIEAQIKQIKAKGELERADKISLLKLQNHLIQSKRKESAIREQAIANYDTAIGNLARIKSEIKK